MSEAYTPLTQAILDDFEATFVSSLLRNTPDLLNFIDLPDPGVGLTPLVAACLHSDEDEALEIAKVLVEHGARIETPDSNEGCFPLLQAANEGKPKLVAYFISLGADLTRTVPNRTTTSVWISAYFGHTECVKLLLEAASTQGTFRHLLEATNLQNKTPSSSAIEYGRAETLGLLVKAGADLRRANPGNYAFGSASDERHRTVAPCPGRPKQYALDMAVLSFKTLSCAGCGEFKKKLLVCSKCRLAYFCGSNCQRTSWPLHKACCSKVCKGRKRYGDPTAEFPKPETAPYGFEDAFTALDEVYQGDKEDYDRSNHPIWEFHTGSRGQDKWERYPAHVEASIESCYDMGSEKYMYTPGDLEAEGMVERDRGSVPPRGIATRYVMFHGLMTEREIYKGATRLVRRNGKRTVPVRDFW